MSQERGVTIDDDTGVVLMESWHHYWVPTMIRNNFCIDDLSQKCHFGRQEGGVTIDDDTGVILMVSLDIQDNISGHSGQLSLKKYRRKTSLNARSPRFSPSGTWASSTTSMGLGSTPTPSSWSSAMTWGLAVGSRSLASIILTQWSSKHNNSPVWEPYNTPQPAKLKLACAKSVLVIMKKANTVFSSVHVRPPYM